ASAQCQRMWAAQRRRSGRPNGSGAEGSMATIRISILPGARSRRQIPPEGEVKVGHELGQSRDVRGVVLGQQTSKIGSQRRLRGRLLAGATELGLGGRLVGQAQVLERP